MKYKVIQRIDPEKHFYGAEFREILYSAEDDKGKKVIVNIDGKVVCEEGSIYHYNSMIETD
jgi:hypothetical protein